jgi:hypothetical protein
MNEELFYLLFTAVLDTLDNEDIDHDSSIIDKHIRAMVTEMETTE